MRRSCFTLLAAWLAGLTGLAWNTASALTESSGSYWQRLPRRHWEDLHIGIGLFTHHRFPVSSNQVLRWHDEAGGVGYREKHRDMERMVAGRAIRPWQFWRTVPARRALMRGRPALMHRFDDSGRPLLLGLGFRALGGIAPFLLPWLGLLAAAPVMLWALFELHAAGRRVAALVLGPLLGVSCYLAGVLHMTYAPIGFYVIALLALAALAVYAALGRPTHAGLLVRAAGGGAVFGICLLCRGSVAFQLPAYLAALVLGTLRQSGPGSARPHPRRAWRVAVVSVLSVAVFSLPGALASLATQRLVERTFAAYRQPYAPPQRHALWFGVWTGLGDFDRDKGYQWLDGAVREVLARRGGTPLRLGIYDPKNEAILREQVTRDICEDPLWYAGILLRRLGATLLQSKLWPWGPLDGKSIEPALSPNQGAIDHYYTLTPWLDTFGMGRWRGELPMPLLVAPVLLFPVLALRRRDLDSLRPLVVLGVLATGALALPVLITTASAPETQAFGLVYLVATALLADIAAGRLGSRPGATARVRGRYAFKA